MWVITLYCKQYTSPPKASHCFIIWISHSWTNDEKMCLFVMVLFSLLFFHLRFLCHINVLTWFFFLLSSEDSMWWKIHKKQEVDGWRTYKFLWYQIDLLRPVITLTGTEGLSGLMDNLLTRQWSLFVYLPSEWFAERHPCKGHHHRSLRCWHVMSINSNTLVRTEHTIFASCLLLSDPQLLSCIVHCTVQVERHETGNYRAKNVF